MNLRSLQYLVALSQQGSFRSAANALGVAQPSISTQIRRFEDELGAKLVVRSTQGAQLTELGQKVVIEALEIFSIVDRIKSLANGKDPSHREIRLGVFPTLSPYLLPYLLPQLRKVAPDIHVLVYDQKSPVLVKELQEETIDVAILADDNFDDSLAQFPVLDAYFVLALPTDHRLARSYGPIDARELKGSELLLLGDGHCLREQTLVLCSEVGASERKDYHVNSVETLRQMVRSGVGPALLPALAVSGADEASQDMRFRRFAAPAPKRVLRVVVRRDDRQADFVPLLRKALGTMPQRVRNPGLRIHPA